MMDRTLLVAGFLILCAGLAGAQSAEPVNIFFANPRLEVSAQAAHDSASFPVGVFPVRRMVDHYLPMRGSMMELLHGPSPSEADSGYASDLQGLYLRRFAIHRGTALVSLRGDLHLGGALAGARLRAQVERTLRQFARIRRVTLLINGRKDFDAMK